jgi:predicted nucleic acid-binding protein
MASISRARKSTTVPVFVDTNVLIYALDRAHPNKQAAASAWRLELWKSRTGRTSYQVLQEFYANVRKKWPSESEAARAEVRDLLAWRPVAVNAELLERGWRISDRYALSFWDAMIVAAAKASCCRYLLTEDLQSGQNLDGVIVVNPFTNAPDFLLSSE